MEKNIVLQFNNPDDAKLTLDTLQVNEIEFLKVDGQGFDGAPTVLSILVAITPLLAPHISNILKSLIEKNKNVKVIHNGTEYSGMSPKEIAQLIKQISNKDNINSKSSSGLNENC